MVIFSYQLWHLLALGPWASDLTSLSLGFLICRTRDLACYAYLCIRFANPSSFVCQSGSSREIEPMYRLDLPQGVGSNDFPSLKSVAPTGWELNQKLSRQNLFSHKTPLLLLSLFSWLPEAHSHCHGDFPESTGSRC